MVPARRRLHNGPPSLYRVRVRGALHGLVALAALAAGCGGREAAPIAVAPPASPAFERPYPQEVTVRLLDHGRPPWRQLRFHPVVGPAPLVTVHVDGAIEATLASRVVEVAASGDFRYELSVVHARSRGPR